MPITTQPKVKQKYWQTGPQTCKQRQHTKHHRAVGCSFRSPSKLLRGATKDIEEGGAPSKEVQFWRQLHNDVFRACNRSAISTSKLGRQRKLLASYAYFGWMVGYVVRTIFDPVRRPLAVSASTSGGTISIYVILSVMLPLPKGFQEDSG